MDIKSIYDKPISILSGGELQRFAICLVLLQVADCYMFDEPTSYLDIRQRIKVSKAIRSLVNDDTKKYVICVEHDLCILDYLSDTICLLYGQPGVYGVISAPMSNTNGINVFLSGYLVSENMRFRDHEINFKFSSDEEGVAYKTKNTHTYPNMSKTLPGFKLNVEAGSFAKSEITVLLGENGTGKTTFIRLLAGIKDFGPDLQDNKEIVLNQLKVSYKPQIINKFI